MKPLILGAMIMAALAACSPSTSRAPDTPQLGSGNVCGDPALFGEVLGVVEGPGACGVTDAVSLRSVSGIELSTAAVMDCNTARALRTWVDTGLVPAVGDTGGGISSIRVAAHYVCRTRNNQPGARLSEHANGRAIDISAIVLRDGQEISVENDWGRGDFGQRLRRMWRSACGPFGTVLGPDGDRFHQNHFHFDTAQHGNGSFCR